MKAEYVIQQLRDQISEKIDFSVNNVFFFGKKNSIESDVIAFSKSGYLTEYEIKTSRADFLADKRKEKWKFYTLYKNFGPKYFYYVAPLDIIKIHEIPSYAGLIEYIEHENRLEFRTKKKASQLNKMKAKFKTQYTLLKKLYYKTINTNYNDIKVKNVKT